MTTIRRPMLSLISLFRLLPVLSLVVLPATAAVIPAYQWLGTGTSNWNDASNWLNSARPDSGAVPGDVTFGASPNNYVYLGSAVTVRSLTFTGNYPQYYFYGSNSAINLGSGGIGVANSGSGRVELGLPVNLAASQTWNTAGTLVISSSITSDNPAFAITKTGSGDLRLSGYSSFAGGLNITQGTAYFSTNTVDTNFGTTSNPAQFTQGPAGTGTVTLGPGTALGALYDYSLTLANAFNLGSQVTFTRPTVLFNSGGTGIFGRSVYTLGGTVSAATAATTITVDPAIIVNFAGQLTGPSSSSLTFTGGGAAVLTGATTASIAGITADAAGVIFGRTGALPATSLNAINFGYVGMTEQFDGNTTLEHASAATLVAKITAPASFAGTIGFDTDPNANSGGNVFHGSLNLSAFTNSSFLGLGSATFASLASDFTITPSTTGDYRFGGGGGRLVVSSSLNGAHGLTVASPESHPLTLVLQGNNTFTGNVGVQHSYLILDNTGALPATARVSLGASGYFSATEWWSGESRAASSLLGFLNLAAIDPTGIIGFDSSGPASFSRVVTDDLNFSALFPVAAPSPTADPGEPSVQGGAGLSLPYLGTTTFGTSIQGAESATGLVIRGNISVPFGLTLKLAGVNGGILDIASPLTVANGITSVAIGHPDSVLGSGGRVVLRGGSNYVGGTTLLSGSLVLGTAIPARLATATTAGPATSPIGLGQLMVDAAASNPFLLPQGDVTLPNSIVVNAPYLKIGDYYSSVAGSFRFDGVISGPGRLAIDGVTTFSAANTYAGGTEVTGGPLTIMNSAGLGTGPVFFQSNGTANFTVSAAIGSLNPDSGYTYGGVPAAGMAAYYNGGTINLAPDTSLTINQTQNGYYSGVINGTNASIIKTGPATLGFGQISSNYSGGTFINQGVLIANGSQNLGTGPVTIAAGASLGLNYGTWLENQIIFQGTSAGRATVGGFGTIVPSGGVLTIGAYSTISPGAKLDTYRNLSSGESSGNEDHVPSVGLLSVGNGEPPAQLVFASGGAYDWGIQNSFMGGGNIWDLISVNGSVAFNADPGSPFQFRLSTYDDKGDAGPLSSFDTSVPHSWTIVVASSITGFSPAKFQIDASSFSNSLGGGSFFLTALNSQGGGNGAALLLNFAPVPEPSTYALLALGLGALTLIYRRRK